MADETLNRLRRRFRAPVPAAAQSTDQDDITAALEALPTGQVSSVVPPPSPVDAAPRPQVSLVDDITSALQALPAPEPKAKPSFAKRAFGALAGDIGEADKTISRGGPTHVDWDPAEQRRARTNLPASGKLNPLNYFPDSALLGGDGSGGKALDKIVRRGIKIASAVPDVAQKLGKGEYGEALKSGAEAAVGATSDKVGFFESMAKSDSREKLPFQPFSWMKLATVKGAADRALAGDYEDAYQRKADEQVLIDFANQVREAEERGQSVGGMVHTTLSQLPAFMVELAASGGTAPGVKKGVEVSARTAAGKLLKKSALKRVGKFLGGAAKRSFKSMPALQQRAVSDFIERRTGTVTIDDKGKVNIDPAATNPASDFLRAQGDLFVEIFSENLGEGFAPSGEYLLKKFGGTEFGKKLASRQGVKYIKGVWKAIHDHFGSNAAVNEALRRGGFNGILAEMGEERIGEILRAISGVQDFGTGNRGYSPQDMWERYKAGFPGGDQALAELIAFTAPGGVKVGAGTVFDRFANRQKAKAGEQEELGKASEEMGAVIEKLQQIHQTNPEQAQDLFEQMDRGELSAEQFLATPVQVDEDVIPGVPPVDEFDVAAEALDTKMAGIIDNAEQQLLQGLDVDIAEAEEALKQLPLPEDIEQRLAKTSAEPVGEARPLSPHELWQEARDARRGRAEEEMKRSGALEYTGDNGLQYMLHKSSRPGVDYQLSRIGADGIPSGHTDYKGDGALNRAIKDFLSETKYAKRPDIPGDFGLLKYEVPRNYIYQGRSRPVGPDSAPPNGLLGTREGGEFGQVVYDRILSEAELERFGLDPVGYEDTDKPKPIVQDVPVAPGSPITVPVMDMDAVIKQKQAKAAAAAAEKARVEEEKQAEKAVQEAAAQAGKPKKKTRKLTPADYADLIEEEVALGNLKRTGPTTTAAVTSRGKTILAQIRKELEKNRVTREREGQADEQNIQDVPEGQAQQQMGQELPLQGQQDTGGQEATVPVVSAEQATQAHKADADVVKKGRTREELTKLIDEARKDITSAEAAIKDWSERVYKTSGKSYEGKDEFGQYAGGKSIDAANERRRMGVIRREKQAIVDAKELIAELEPELRAMDDAAEVKKDQDEASRIMDANPDATPLDILMGNLIDPATGKLVDDREPWEMTPTQYLDGATDVDEIAIKKSSHPRQVRDAVEAGKPVPDEVLEAYRHNNWAKTEIAARKQEQADEAQAVEKPERKRELSVQEELAKDIQETADRVLGDLEGDHSKRDLLATMNFLQTLKNKELYKAETPNKGLIASLASEIANISRLISEKVKAEEQADEAKSKTEAQAGKAEAALHDLQKPTKAEALKESWQKTKAEHNALLSEKALAAFGETMHRRSVLNALADGEDVPDRVVADYKGIREEAAALAEQNKRDDDADFAREAEEGLPADLAAMKKAKVFKWVNDKQQGIWYGQFTDEGRAMRYGEVADTNKTEGRKASDDRYRASDGEAFATSRLAQKHEEAAVSEQLRRDGYLPKSDASKEEALKEKVKAKKAEKTAIVKASAEVNRPTSLPQPTQDDAMDRQKQAGIDYEGPANSVVIQLRDLESNPLWKGLLANKYDGTQEGAARVVVEMLKGVDRDYSRRESPIVVTDENGVAKWWINADQTNDRIQVVETPTLWARKSWGLDKKAEKIDSFAAIDRFNDALDNGQVTPEKLKAAYASFLENKDKLKSLLESKQKKVLVRFAGIGSSMSDKKADLVRSALNSISQTFVLGDSFVWSPFTETLEEAVQKRVDATTQADLDAHIERQRKRAEESEERKKRIADPQSLEDFERIVRVRSRDALTQEQKEKYDELKAEDRRNREKAQKRPVALRPDEVGETGFSIVDAHNEKKDIPLKVVQMTDRVDKDTFSKLRSLAKANGGYYSRFAKGRAKPGFQFNNEEDAEAFIAAAKGDAAPAEAKDAPAQSQAQKLRDIADKMAEAADEKLNQDRQTNTAKRAREAGYAMESARQDLQFAETMKNIADAIDNGEATHLAGVTQKTQIEAIQKAMSAARRAVARAEGASYGSKQYNEIYDGPWKSEYAEKVKYPQFDAGRELLNDYAKQLEGIKGGLLLSKQLRKVAREGGTLTPEMADKVIKKLGKAAWWLSDRKTEIGRLQRADIKTAAELRAAVRELGSLMGEKKKEDPIKAAELALVGMKFEGMDFFPTPPSVAAELAERADIQPGMSVLEPSAGKGDIADAVRQAVPNAQIDVVEPAGALRDVLEAKGFTPVARDFMEHEGQYDRIVMNPPFSRGRDVEHVRHAYSLLKPGGKMIAIMGEHPFFANDKTSKDFRDWLDSVGGESEERPDMFKGPDAFRQTGVNSRIVEIEKPGRRVLNASPSPVDDTPMLQSISLAANSPMELRPSDVERVLEDYAQNQNVPIRIAISALQRQDISQRVVLRLREIMSDLAQEEKDREAAYDAANPPAAEQETTAKQGADADVEKSMLDLVRGIEKQTDKLNRLNESQSQRLKTSGRSRGRSTTYNANASNAAAARDGLMASLAKEARAQLKQGVELPNRVVKALGSRIDYNEKGEYDPIEGDSPRFKTPDAVVQETIDEWTKLIEKYPDSPEVREQAAKVIAQQKVWAARKNKGMQQHPKRLQTAEEWWDGHPQYGKKIEIDDLAPEAQNVARDIEKTMKEFGVRVDFTLGGKVGYAGLTPPQVDNFMVLNADRLNARSTAAGSNLYRTMVHEALHVFFIRSDADRKKLVSAVKRFAPKQFAKAMRKIEVMPLYKNISTQLLEEEASVSVLQDVANNTEFWKKLGAVDSSLSSRVRTAIVDMMRKVANIAKQIAGMEVDWSKDLAPDVAAVFNKNLARERRAIELVDAGIEAIDRKSVGSENALEWMDRQLQRIRNRVEAGMKPGEVRPIPEYRDIFKDRADFAKARNQVQEVIQSAKDNYDKSIRFAPVERRLPAPLMDAVTEAEKRRFERLSTQIAAAYQRGDFGLAEELDAALEDLAERLEARLEEIEESGVEEDQVVTSASSVGIDIERDSGFADPAIWMASTYESMVENANNLAEPKYRSVKGVWRMQHSNGSQSATMPAEYPYGASERSEKYTKEQFADRLYQAATEIPGQELKPRAALTADQIIDAFKDAFESRLARRRRAGVDGGEGVRFAPAPPTDSEAFKRWFGDSKVVDADGNPLVVYHGTRRPFNQFEISQPRGAIGNKPGIYFTPDRRVAEEYAMDVDGAMDEKSRVIAAYIKIENDSDGEVVDSDYRGREYVVFKPSNVKSATANVGTFDPNNADIRFASMETPEPTGTQDAGSLRELHEMRDAKKADKLIKSMTEKGWQGRPVLTISDYALTASHRLYAARELNLDVPVYELDYNETQEAIDAAEDDAVNAFGAFPSTPEDILSIDDEYLPAVFDILARSGVNDAAFKDAAELMRIEVKNNADIRFAPAQGATDLTTLDGVLNAIEKGADILARGGRSAATIRREAAKDSPYSQSIDLIFRGGVEKEYRRTASGELKLNKSGKPILTEQYKDFIKENPKARKKGATRSADQILQAITQEADAGAAIAQRNEGIGSAFEALQEIIDAHEAYLDGIVEQELFETTGKDAWDRQMMDIFGPDQAVNISAIYEFLTRGENVEKAQQGTLPKFLMKALTKRIDALDKATTKKERRAVARQIRERTNVARKARTVAAKETAKKVAGKLEEKAKVRGIELPGKPSDSPSVVLGKAITAAIKEGKRLKQPVYLRDAVVLSFKNMRMKADEAERIDPEKNENKHLQRVHRIFADLKAMEFRLMSAAVGSEEIFKHILGINTKEESADMKSRMKASKGLMMQVSKAGAIVDKYLKTRLPEMFGADRYEAMTYASDMNAVETYKIMVEEANKEIQAEYRRKFKRLFIGDLTPKKLPSGAKIRVRAPLFKMSKMSASLREQGEALMGQVRAVAAKSFKRRANEDIAQMVDERIGIIADKDPEKAMDLFDKLQRGEITQEDVLGMKLPDVETREDKARNLLAGITGKNARAWKGEAGLPGLQDLVQAGERLLQESKTQAERVGIKNKVRRDEMADSVMNDVIDGASELKSLDKGRPKATKARKLKMWKRSLKSIGIALAGGNEKSMTAWLFGEQHRRANNKQTDIKGDIDDEFEALLKKLGIGTMERLRMESDQKRQVLSNGKTVFFTRAQKIEMLGVTLDDEMRDNMMHNGFRSQDLDWDREQTIVGEGASAMERYLNTARLVNEILEGMSDKDITIAKEMSRLMTEMGAQGNEVWRKIDATDRFLSKSYWPGSGKVDRKEAGWEQPEPGLEDKFGKSDMVQLVDNFGHNKERVPHRHPILIGNAFKTFENHVRDMSVFIAYSQLQRDVNSVLTNDSVEKEIKARWGLALIPEMKRYLSYLTFQESASDNWTPTQRMAAAVQRNFSVRELAFKTSSMMLNRVGGTIGNMTWLKANRPELLPAYIKRAANPFKVPFVLIGKEARAIRDDLNKYGGFRRRWGKDSYRVQGQSYKEDLGLIDAGASVAKEYIKIRWQQLQNVSMAGMSVMEMRNVVELVQSFEDNGMSRAKALDLADEITRDTQNPATSLEETIMYRNIKKTAFAGLFLPFLGQPAVISDMFGREFDKARYESRTDKKVAAKRLASVSFGIVLMGMYAVVQRAAFRAAYRGFLGGDDDDDKKKKDVEFMIRLRDMAQELADLIVPGLGRTLDLPSALIESLISGNRDAFRGAQRPGSVIGRMSMSLIQFLTEATEAVQTGEVSWYEVERIASSLNYSIGSLFGTPTGGAEQAFKVGKGVLGFQKFGTPTKEEAKREAAEKRRQKTLLEAPKPSKQPTRKKTDFGSGGRKKTTFKPNPR